MDILEKLDRMLTDTTCHAAGSVDMSQGPYGSNIMGYRRKKKKKGAMQESKPNPKMAIIDAIRDFIMDQRTWFEFDDAGDDYIYLTTRENGDVGNETPGQADWREGQRLAKAIKQNFKNAKISLDYTDEWVNLEVRV
jgi:hypothetical protein